MSLKNRNLVVKRDGQNFLLPCFEYLAFQTKASFPQGAYLLFRVEGFDQETGNLQLQHAPGGIWNDKSYQISTEVNSADLIAAGIQNISIIDRKPSVFAAKNSFNNDIDLAERLNATRYEAEESTPSLSFNTNETFPSSSLTQQNVIIKISLKIQDIKLEDGRATFKYFFPPERKEIAFEVPNQQIKSEFDAIKNYIAKVLGLKRFECHLHSSTIGGVASKPFATSQHIDMINEELLEKVADHYIDNEVVSGTSDLLALDEKLVVINTLFPEEKKKDLEWLLEKIFARSAIKHYIHLRFLSSKHKADLAKMMMTGKPLSFIFLIESKGNYFLIWETYKTEEATYLWQLQSHTPETIANEVQTLITKITWLRGGKKRAYIDSKPSNFRRIEHEYSGEDFGFKKWQAQFQEFIGSLKN